MIRARAFALPLLLAALPPTAQAEDQRITERFYNASQVVRIDGRTKVQATIEFAENEMIENVAIGDSEAWQVTPNKRANLLFVKPLAPTAATNMTVVTDRRTYLFDLVASPRSRPIYVMRFTYPKDVAPPAPAIGSATSAELAAVAEAGRLDAAKPDPATLNFAWAGKGERKLLPARTYDDGTATYLAWPAGAPVPAILARDEKGTEGPVNFAVRDGVIVVDGVPRELVLRSGKAVATLANTAPPREPASAPAPAAPAALALNQGAK